MSTLPTPFWVLLTLAAFLGVVALWLAMRARGRLPLMPAWLSRLKPGRKYSSVTQPYVESPGEAAPQTPTPTPKPRRPARRIRGLRALFNPGMRASVSVCLVAQLETGTEVIYVLHPDGRAERVAAVPADCRLVLSVTVEDLRMALPQGQPSAAAKSRLIREAAVYEKLAITTAGPVAYGTRAARVAEYAGHRLAPLVALADRLSIQHGGEIPKVAGFVLGDTGGDIALAVFFVLAADGCKTHIALAPDDLGSVYHAFITSHGLAEDLTPLIFTQAEALAALAGFYAAYPADGDVLGVPVRLLWRGALVTGGVAAVATGAWWQAVAAEHAALQAEVNQLRGETTQATTDAGRHIVNHLPGFVRHMGLRPGVGLAEAESLYRPGARVEVEADATGRRHEVFVAVHRRDTSAEQPRDTDLREAMELRLAGCERTGVEFAGGLDEIRIRFSCPAGRDVAARYRG